MVESGGLENRCALQGTVGSNPTLSANTVDVDLVRKRGGLHLHSVTNGPGRATQYYEDSGTVSEAGFTPAQRARGVWGARR